MILVKFFCRSRGHTRMQLAFALLLMALPLLAFADDEHVNVTLLSESSALVPGATAWLGVRLQHEPHWHTYWINPGDSGLPTKLAWQLPPGFGAGEINWPTPTRISLGDLQNFGYEGDVLLPVPLQVPADAKPGTLARIGAEVKYLVCREECIPGKASIALDLPVRASGGAGAQQSLFAATRAAQPRQAAWTGAARVRGDRIEMQLHAADLPAISDAFVVQRKLVNYAPPQISRNGDALNLSFAKSDYFTVAPAQIDLVLRAGTNAWRVSVPFSSSP
jgi:DsbC/DsbD-like thiol-disulfide interchange protein